MNKPKQKEETKTELRNPILDWKPNEALKRAFDLETKSPKEAIRIAFPLKFQQPIVETANWALDYFTDKVGEKVVSQILINCEMAGRFGRFFAVLGLEETDGGRDLAIYVEDIIDESENDDEIVWRISLDISELASENIDYINGVSRLLTLSKDDIINELIIPNYKVGKASHLWLEDLTESAFSKGCKEIFGSIRDIPMEIWQLQNKFDDGDHVSIFEYFMEGLDLQNLMKSKNLNKKQIIDLLVKADFINEIEAKWVVNSDFVGEILYLQEAYGFCLGDFLESPTIFEEDGLLPKEAKKEEVYNLLLSFHKIVDLAPKDDVDFPSEAKKHHKEVMDFYPNLLDFALANQIPQTLFDVLTQEQLNEWETPFQNALKTAELSRIKACLEEEEFGDMLDYLVSVFNREVYNWEMPMKDYKVILEDLEEWIQEFKILERWVKANLLEEERLAKEELDFLHQDEGEY